MKLPIEERRKILEKAANDPEIQKAYEEGGELRKFQALGKDDFYPNSKR